MAGFINCLLRAFIINPIYLTKDSPVLCFICYNLGESVLYMKHN